MNGYRRHNGWLVCPTKDFENKGFAIQISQIASIRENPTKTDDVLIELSSGAQHTIKLEYRQITSLLGLVA